MVVRLLAIFRYIYPFQTPATAENNNIMTQAGDKVIIRTGKIYDNSNGYFFFPSVWREEFGIQVGDIVGIDSLQGEVVIDKHERKYKRKILDKGKVNIPLELRVQLQNVCYEILIEQDKERVILTPR